MTRQTAIPVLIGTKYDAFAAFPKEEQEEITKQAKRFSKAMHAPLVGTICTPLLYGINRTLNQPDLLLDLTLHQCAEDLQDCTCKGLRAQGESILQ